MQLPLNIWFSIHSRLNILGGTEIQNYAYQISISDSLAPGRRMISADRCPYYLAMVETIFCTNVTVYYFQDHFGAELTDPGATNTGKLLLDSVRQGVFERFIQ